jgi:hypothetical protein
MALQLTNLNTPDLDYITGIPEYFTNINDRSAVIIAASEEDELRGLMITSVTEGDPKRAVVQYTWIDEKEISSGRVQLELLLELRTQLKKRRVAEISVFCQLLDGIPQGAFSTELLEGAGGKKAPGKISACGWYVQDVFDTPFFAGKLHLSAVNENIKYFREFSENRCRINLGKLGALESNIPAGMGLECPYGRFYMDGNIPKGVMTMEMPDDDSVLIPDAYISEDADEDKVFEDLLAGVLDCGLEGYGMDARIFGRFSLEKGKDQMERLLGSSTIPVEYIHYTLKIH